MSWYTATMLRRPGRPAGWRCRVASVESPQATADRRCSCGCTPRTPTVPFPCPQSSKSSSSPFPSRCATKYVRTISPSTAAAVGVNETFPSATHTPSVAIDLAPRTGTHPSTVAGVTTRRGETRNVTSGNRKKARSHSQISPGRSAPTAGSASRVRAPATRPGESDVGQARCRSVARQHASTWRGPRQRYGRRGPAMGLES